MERGGQSNLDSQIVMQGKQNKRMHLLLVMHVVDYIEITNTGFIYVRKFHWSLELSIFTLKFT